MIEYQSIIFLYLWTGGSVVQRVSARERGEAEGLGVAFRFTPGFL